MKFRILVYALMPVLTSCGGINGLPSAKFDRGGQSFDFAAISARRFDADGTRRPTEAENFPIWLEARPLGALDGRFALSEGQCGVVSFGWRTRRRVSYDWARFGFELVLPRGYRLLGTTFARADTLTRTKMSDGTQRIRFLFNDDKRQRPRGWMNNQRPLNLLVAPMRGAGEGRLSLVCLENGKTPVSAAVSLTLYTVPAVKAAAVPKRFHNGFDASCHLLFSDGAAYDALARFFGDVGAGWLVQFTDNAAFVPYWKKYAHGPVTPLWDDNIENGMVIGDPANRPENERFVAVTDGFKPRRAQYVQNGTCPRAVYREMPYFREVTLPALRKLIAGADGLWGNWEPSSFETAGCMCTACRETFAKWKGLDEATVVAGWPKNLKSGAPWHADGVRFRSLEHAKIVKTLNRHVSAATGADASCGFIPGVAWIEMADFWRCNPDYAAEVRPLDYASDLKWINPWGPYVKWDTFSPFVYDKRLTLLHWIAAKDVRATVDADYPAAKRPRLLSYPQGQQCGNWSTQPEYIEMALDSFFFNRWDANCVYYFPNGYDARYWKAFAAATTRAARYEDFVFNGRSADASVTLKTVPEYAAPVKQVTAWLPKYVNEPLLRSAAFDCNGTRIVAVLNFWDRGEAFFNLSVRDLPPGRYCVIADGTLYAPSRRTAAWTEKELAAGIRLAVGATRTRVFEIRPFRKGSIRGVRDIMTRQALDTLYKEAKPRLLKEAERDAEEDRKRPKVKKDWMAVT